MPVPGAICEHFLRDSHFHQSKSGITLTPSVILNEVSVMAATLTTKGQVTIPKKVRDALHVGPGSAVEFDVNNSGEIVLRKASSRVIRLSAAKRDRFDKVRGTAQIKWRTDKLMELLRG